MIRLMLSALFAGAALLSCGVKGDELMSEVPTSAMGLLQRVVEQQAEQIIHRVLLLNAGKPAGSPTNKHQASTDIDDEDFEFDDGDDEETLVASGIEKRQAGRSSADYVTDKRSLGDRKARLAACLSITQQILAAADSLLDQQHERIVERYGAIRSDDFQRMMQFGSLSSCYSKIDQKLADEIKGNLISGLGEDRKVLGTVKFEDALKYATITAEDPVLLDDDIMDALQSLIKDFAKGAPSAGLKSQGAIAEKLSDPKLLSFVSVFYFTVIMGGLGFGFYRIYVFLQAVEGHPSRSGSQAAQQKKGKAFKESKKKR